MPRQVALGTRTETRPMKFNCFHHMPYPDLPDDFDDTEKYPSPSLTFSNENFDPQVGHTLYHRYLDELEYADELGFDGIIVNDHHQPAYGLMPSPHIIAADPAPRTNHAPHHVPGHRLTAPGHPIRGAEHN